MKSALLNLWAWVLLHPEAVVSAALAVLSVIVGATIANARAQGAPESWPERFVDRLAVRTRANASNAGWSWPIVGKSIFEAAIDASAPRETQPPPLPPSEPGFVERSILLVVGGVAALALGVMLLAGCSPTLPADLYRGVGTGVAVTAAGGREVALLEARDCLAKASRAEAEACLLPWRARWAPIAQAWQGAASRSQSLAAVVVSVDAALERRWPAMDAGAAVVDAGAVE
jgi:hypothetical protein